MNRNNRRNRTPLKDTKIGLWLSKNAPEILSVAGEVTPIGGGMLRFIADKIQKRQDLTSEQLERWDEIYSETQKEITKRWEADMASDSWLPKNIRPLTLAVLLVVFLSLVIVDSTGSINFEVSEAYISMLQVLMTTVFTAYFAGRSYEKIKR